MISHLDSSNIEQATLLDLLENTDQSIFLTGKAGTGKSTLLRYIKKHTAKKYVALASTGIAALNIGGQTIHSFFKLPFRPLPWCDELFLGQRANLYATFAYSKAHRTLLREIDLIIIDEVSMVRADVIDAIDRILRIYRNREHLPFGGVQMLFVGDLYQLEPVTKPDERDVLGRFYRSMFFFSAEVFKYAPLTTIELKKVYRQRENDFVDILDRARVGAITREDLERLNQRVSAESNDLDAKEVSLILGTKRQQVARINSERLAQLPTELIELKGRVHDEFPEQILPVQETLYLKVGAQVMFVINDREKRWVNGSLGIVEAYEENNNQVMVRVSETGQLCAVVMNKWENIRYRYDEKKEKVLEEVIGYFVQYPLSLAWAVTVHKSQGLTFERMTVDFRDGVFASGQAYVALSRCVSLDGLTLRTPLSYRNFIVRPEIVQFYSKANSPQDIQRARMVSDGNRMYVDAAQAWRAGDYLRAIETLKTAVLQNNQLSNPSILRLICQKLITVMLQKEQIVRLSEDLQDSKEKLSQMALEHVSLGEECLTEHADHEAALSCFQKAIDLDSKCLPALIGKGRCLALRADDRGVVSYMRQVVDMYPNSSEAQFAYAEILIGYRAREEAIQPLLKTLALDPMHLGAAKHLLLIYTDLGDEDNIKRYRGILRKLNSQQSE